MTSRRRSHHRSTWTLYHDGGDDGDEGVAVGQESVGGRGAAQGLSVGRSDALREQRGGGGGGGGGSRSAAPRLLLLHLLLDVVLYDVAVLHPGGATREQGTRTGPWRRSFQPALFANSRGTSWQMGRETGSSVPDVVFAPSLPQRSLFDEDVRSARENWCFKMVVWKVNIGKLEYCNSITRCVFPASFVFLLRLQCILCVFN